MIYDTIVIGGGPAGLSAGIYLQRYKVKNLIIAKGIGGYAAEAHSVENYPGFPKISGGELVMKFNDHLEKLGGKIVMEDVQGVKKDGDIFKVQTLDECYEAKTVILASGTVRRKLGIPGEDKLLGKGVSYCATCDAMFFKDKTVAVVGGNDASAGAAVLLSDIAKQVYIIYRKEKLRCDPHWMEHVEKAPNVEIINNTTVTEVKGENKVESVTLDSGKELAIDGLFIEIGSVPSADIARSMGVNVTEDGYIDVNEEQATSVPGLYAAGDISSNSNKFRQIITAASEGAVASEAIYNYLKKH